MQHWAFGGTETAAGCAFLKKIRIEFHWREVFVLRAAIILKLVTRWGGLMSGSGAVADPKIWKWGRGGMYQPVRHLSQMHTTNYMLFIREKATYWKQNSEPLWVGHCSGVDSACWWRSLFSGAWITEAVYQIAEVDAGSFDCVTEWWFIVMPGLYQNSG